MCEGAAMKGGNEKVTQRNRDGQGGSSPDNFGYNTRFFRLFVMKMILQLRKSGEEERGETAKSAY